MKQIKQIIEQIKEIIGSTDNYSFKYCGSKISVSNKSGKTIELSTRNFSETQINNKSKIWITYLQNELFDFIKQSQSEQDKIQEKDKSHNNLFIPNKQIIQETPIQEIYEQYTDGCNNCDNCKIYNEYVKGFTNITEITEKKPKNELAGTLKTIEVNQSGFFVIDWLLHIICNENINDYIKVTVSIDLEKLDKFDKTIVKIIKMIGNMYCDDHVYEETINGSKYIELEKGDKLIFRYNFSSSYIEKNDRNIISLGDLCDFKINLFGQK